MKPVRAKSLIFAATLFPSEAPLDHRLKVLSPIFNPAPGSEIKLDDFALKEFGPKDKDRGLIYGHIGITPPKGTCLTITRTMDRPDTEVCKKTELRWQLKDLDRNTGELSWSVRTGPHDFGTPLSWKTGYVIAKFIPSGLEFNDANSTPMFFKSCDAVAADPIHFVGRRINLTLLNGKTWTIRFPDEDTPLPAFEPPPPPPPPAEDEKKKKAPAQGEEQVGSESSGGADAKKVEPPKPKAPVVKPEAWTLATRRGFEMPVSQVIAGGSSAAVGTKGKCRYQYDGIQGDFDTGRIECHYGDNFLYFYAPLPCLKYIMPSAKKIH